MKKPILFIQGGGAGAYEEDKELAASLQAVLGVEYTVLYPQMPNEDNPEDEEWKTQISKELAALDGTVILVGHSVGAAVLLIVLSEENVEKPIAGVFLIAPPYWDGFAPQLPKGLPVFLYHSRDDEVVPFEHLTRYAEKLPQATIREFNGRGHQLNNDLSEVAADIIGLKASPL
jgi:predicted alpha/beta hydrolase family esterase